MMDMNKEAAEFTLTIVSADGRIISQQTGYRSTDKLPAFTGPGGRYLHRADHDIREALRKASIVPRRARKTRQFVYGCTEQQRTALMARFAADPTVSCETVDGGQAEPRRAAA